MSELIEIKCLKFDFRNKYKLMEYVNNLKEVIVLIKPLLEEFLQNKNLSEFSLNNLKLKEKIIHLSITDIKKEGELQRFGDVGRVKSTGEIIIPLRIVCDNDTINNFELMKTFVHEFLHFFVEGEEKVVNTTELFLENLNLKTKVELGRIWKINFAGGLTNG